MEEQTERTYITVDLKSFYAAVECMDRDLDPLTTNLVVADESRTEKTICLAVSPSLKEYGISGRARLFEVVEAVKQLNNERLRHAPGHVFRASSCDAEELADPSLAISYLVAPPQMARYLKISSQIYEIYLRYIAPEDIHVYSVDEVFMDVTSYLKIYGMTARQLATRIIKDVLAETGITAAAGIGPNLYLSKVAIDIGAKHIRPDENGVRIAQLDVRSYREQMWTHEPLTDFWRVGRGSVKRLAPLGVTCMGDIARLSLSQWGEDLLYRTFGINAELLIDHAWGFESCTIADIKAYKPETNSINSGQVLKHPYPFDKARMVVREMAESLAMTLLDKGLVTDQLVLTVGYDTENLADPEKLGAYRGEVTTDRYGRNVPKHAHGTIHLGRRTSSVTQITDAALNLFDRIMNPSLTARRMFLTADHVVGERETEPEVPEQLDRFTDYKKQEEERAGEDAKLEKEKRRQQAVLSLQKKYGKNVILKGVDLTEDATARERNGQIGGHKA